MTRRSAEQPSERAAAGPFASLLSRARAQSHELADSRAARLFPIALPAAGRSPRRGGLWGALPIPSRPAWSLAAVCAALIVGGGGTWALVSGPRVTRDAAGDARPATPGLGAALADACRAAGPSPVARRPGRPAAAGPMQQQERAVIARAPAPAPRAELAVDASLAQAGEAKPAGTKPTSIVLDGPQETVIIVAPPVKHKALWTPKDFSRYMRQRMGRDN